MIDFWTAERTDRLRQLHAQGFSHAEIARRIGTTRNATIGKIARLRLAKPRQPLLTSEEKAARRVERMRIDAMAKRIKREAIKPTGRVYLAGNGQVRPVYEAPQPELRVVATEPLHLSLIDLQSGDCRYPYGDGPFTFCGQPALICGSYCKAHADLCAGASIRYRATPQKQSARTLSAGWV